MVGAAVEGDLRERIAAVAARHGLALGAARPAARVGAHSTVYLLPEAALKVAQTGPEAGAAVRRDAAVAPVARAAGVRVPRLLAFDDTGDVLSAPYAVFERVRGGPLASPRAGREEIGAAWRALGRDLALVHDRADASGAPPLAALARFAQSPEVDPRPWAEVAATAGHLGTADSNRLIGLLDRLAPAALAPISPRWGHGDVNAGNVLADPPRRGYLALIDWAGSVWLDPAWDFASAPLAAVPHILAGHRDVAPLPADETAEARILWCRLQHALFGLRNARPGTCLGRRRARRLLANVKRLGHWVDAVADAADRPPAP
jgi:aminoglycoside phosphotransferase (APT) family kinase protein